MYHILIYNLAIHADILWCNFSILKYVIGSKDVNLNNYSSNSPIECFLEADLDYLDELHGLNNEYPSAGENTKETEEILS